MFEAPRNLTFVDDSPNRDGLTEPLGSRGIYSKSDDLEKQARSPYSNPLAGSTNVSIADTLNDEDESSAPSKRSKLGKYFLSDIDRNWTEAILISCGFVSGLVDGLSFTFWSSFSSMQTGMHLVQPNPTHPTLPSFRLPFLFYSSIHHLTTHRKHNQPRPRRLRQPTPPRQTLGQSPNRRRRLPPRHLLLHRGLLDARPPPAHNNDLLLRPPNDPHHGRRHPRPHRRHRRNTIRRSHPLATRRRHRTTCFPGSRADPGVEVSGVSRDHYCCVVGGYV